MANLLAKCSLFLTIVACATAKTDPTLSFAPTTAAPPADLRDTILQVAIRAAIGDDSSVTVRRILLQPPLGVNPHRILPPLPKTTFVTLSGNEFQQLADRVGTITRWVVGTPHIYGDSATVQIWASPVTPPNTPIVSSGGGCTYVLNRSTNGWRVGQPVTCIYLD